jgi:hypothetical protein
MLFDLRARGRRTTVKVIYSILAILMAGGLVFFGVGGATGGGLADLFNGDNNSTSVSDTFEKRERSLERQINANPRNARLWAELTRVRYQLATSAGDGGIDNSTGAYTDEAKVKLAAAARAWDRYLALDPAKPDDQVAALMVQVLGPLGLNKLADATTAQEIVVERRPAAFGLYAQLAQLAYLAGQDRKGDLARKKAIELAPKDQKPTVKSQIDAAKQQAAQQQTGVGTTTP